MSPGTWRRGIEVGLVELMLYVKPLQEKRCAGGHCLELVMCEWALSGSSGVRVGSSGSRGER